MSSIVEVLTLTEKEVRRQSPTAAGVATQKRKLHRLMAVEHMYCARNPAYVAELSIAAMSIGYAECNSRLVVNMLGRIGPGGSYPLLKQWLKENVGEPDKVPNGIVHIAFDKEQRLVKNC